MSATLNITVPIHAASTTRVPLTLMLAFADGSQISFHETEATDVGTIDDGPIHQRCLRQLTTDKTWLVDFRPEVDGSRDEVVIEYGTLIKFGAIGVAPQTAGIIAPAHVMAPASLNVTKTTGGTGSVANPIAMVAISYVMPSGEGLAFGQYAWLNMAATDRMLVASPLTVPGATGYHVYVCSYNVTPNNLYIRQTTTPVPFGQSWTSPAGGFVLTGIVPPTESGFPVYKATVSGGTLASPVTTSVYHHEFGARWRFQSKARPAVRTAQDLVTLKVVPPLSLAYVGNTPAPPVFSYDFPMSQAGLFGGEGTPGERPELGLITEQQAHWILTGNAGSYSTMIAQAEAVGGMAIIVRDVDTGAPVDFSVRKYVCLNDANHGPYQIPRPQINAVAAPTHWSLEESHHPALSAVPYAITRDPYFLEHHHAQTSFGYLETNLNQINLGLPCLANRIEARSMAWHLRDIARTLVLTPSVTPSWILPLARWQTYVADNVEYGRRYIAATASPCTTVFKFFPEITHTQGFAEDYLAHALGYIMWSRAMPTMDTLINYFATSRIAMGYPPATPGAKNKYGWDPRYPIFYYGPVSDARLKGAATAPGNKDYTIAASVNTPTTWSELFDDLIAWAKVNDHVEDPSVLGPNTISSMQSGYLPWVRSGLAVLAQAGIPEAQAAHDFLAPKITGLMYKWSFAPPV